jgi:FkbM family methyltransferase
MQYNYSTTRLVANALRNTPFYPAAKVVYRQIFNREYLLRRRKLMEFFSPFVKPGDLVFDVGANVGEFVDAFLKMGAKVCAVEPNPFCVSELKALYNGNPNFILVDKGLGASEGKNTMYLGEKGMHNVSTLSVEWKEEAKKLPGLSIASWDKKVEIDITTLDQLIKEYGVPSVCKIDVEGFEYEVLSGLHQPIPCMSLEYTPWRIDPAIECIKYLNKLESYQFNISMTLSREDVGELHFQDWLDSDKMINLLDKEIRNTSTVGDLYAKVIL